MQRGARAGCAGPARRSLGHGGPVAEGHRAARSRRQPRARRRVGQPDSTSDSSPRKPRRLEQSIPDVAARTQQVVSLLTATTGFAPERARYARPLMILSGITALVLLVACVNFTNLMLARSEGRRRSSSFAWRSAAGRGGSSGNRRRNASCWRSWPGFSGCCSQVGRRRCPQAVCRHDYARRACASSSTPASCVRGAHAWRS